MMASHLQKKKRAAPDFDRKEAGEKYPIVVVEYDPVWAELYRAEARFLKSRFGPEVIVRIEHFGSTAVPGSAAKPVIDILVEVTSFKMAKRKIIPELKNQGYGYAWVTNQPKPPGHMMFMKGYDIEGAERLRYHFHMAPAGHPLWDRLFFRDYLRRHPETVRRYEKLKYRLAGLYRNDREAYTEGKAGFVKKITDKAKKL